MLRTEHRAPPRTHGGPEKGVKRAEYSSTWRLLLRELHNVFVHMQVLRVSCPPPAHSSLPLLPAVPLAISARVCMLLCRHIFLRHIRPIAIGARSGSTISISVDLQNCCSRLHRWHGVHVQNEKKTPSFPYGFCCTNPVLSVARACIHFSPYFLSYQHTFKLNFREQTFLSGGLEKSIRHATFFWLVSRPRYNVRPLR